MATGFRQRLFRACTALCALLASVCAWGEGDTGSWRPEKSGDGIHVYSRAVEGSSVRAVKAEVAVDAAFEDAVALLLDASQRPRWDELCAEASIVRRVSETEDVAYIHNDLPWPVSDRDMVLRRIWSVDADRSRAQIRASVMDGVLPEIAGRVRVTHADGVWTIERGDAAGVHITTEIHADPGGPVPDWLMNALSVQGPYKALRNIRHLLESREGDPGPELRRAAP